MNHEEILKKFKYLEKKDIEYQAELKNIDKRLKEELECSDLEEAKNKRTKINDKIEESKKRRKILLEKIEKVTDWDEIEIEED